MAKLVGSLSGVRQGLFLNALLLLQLSSVPTWAVLGTNDLVPAATLLAPYFEVDLTTATGTTTILTVRNVDPAPAIVHAVVWTDLGVPTVTFDILLNGYATKRIDLRELFEEGTVGFPAFGGNCQDLSEFGVAARAIPALQRAHRGLSSTLFQNDCGAINHGDRVVRGYVTFDNVTECSTAVPSDNGYFEDGGLGIANDVNSLWGEYALVDGLRSRALGEPMVHIEATDEENPEFGSRTFYAQLVGGGRDEREPLAQSWGVRYFHELTDIVCWRDEIERSPFPCQQSPPAAQLFGDVISFDNVIATVFDHESSSDTTDDTPAPCAGTTRRTSVGSESFPAFPKTGWIYIDTDAENPVAQTQGFTISQQGYVAAFHRNHPAGRSVATGGVALDPVLPIGEQLVWPGSTTEQAP